MPSTRVKDDVRDTWLSRVFETFAQDMRYGLRNLRRNPGFALVVIVTTALGIGANTAIFSVVNGVLLRPLPYREWRSPGGAPPAAAAGGCRRHRVFRRKSRTTAQARSLDGMAEFHNMWFILLGRSEPERVATGVVSSNFFDLLGVQPVFGRDVSATRDEKPGAPGGFHPEDKYWQRSFGGDPSVVGQLFQMNDRPHQVIGVLPAVPQYPLEVDVYMPTSACPFRRAGSSSTTGRLA